MNVRTSAPGSAQRWSTLPALIVVAIAGAALAGWFFDQPLLASWRRGAVPMAPSTSLMALLLGFALLIASAPAPSHGRRRLVCAIAVVTGLVAASLLVDRLRGVFSPVEHLGLSIAGQVGNSATGFISPVTAGAFVAASVSLALIACRGRRVWTARVGAGMSAGLVVVGFALLLLNVYGVPLWSHDAFIPPALASSLLISALGVGLWQGARRAGHIARSAVRPMRDRTVFAAIATMIAAAIVTGSYGYYRNEERAVRHQSEQELDAIARLKVDHLAHWRLERLADGHLLSRNAAFSTLVTDYLKRGDTARAAEVRTWLDGYAAYPDYDAVYLVDATGVVRVSALSTAAPVSPAILDGVRLVLRSGVVGLVDFHLEETRRLAHLAVVSPIADAGEPRHWIGAVVLRVDPGKVLAPFVEGWPNSSVTGETLLVRRENDHVLTLTTPRFASNGAMQHRSPLDQHQWLTTQAGLGHEGPAEGLDYHGAPAIGILRAVPESAWALVTLVDRDELDDALWHRFWQVSAGAGVLLFGMGMGLAFVWQRQRTLLISARHAEERRSHRLAQLYAALSKCTDAIVRCSTETALFARVCEVAVTDGGLAMAWVGLLDEDSGIVRPVASFGRGTEYLDGIKITVDESNPLGRGPTGRSIRERRPQWSSDFMHDPSTAPWRDRGSSFGWVASGAIPLARADRVIGALTVYGAAQDTFDIESQRLLIEMAASVSLGLDLFDREARRREAEARMEESAELYRKVFSEGRLARLLVDPATGRIVEANPAAVTLYGWPPDTLVGMRMTDINTAPEDVVRDALRRAAASDQTRFEFRHRTAPGRIIDVEILSSSVTVRGRALLMSTVLDVTEQKQLQAQFLQSQKMEVVGRLAGGIAHDFNNLLTVINGTAEVAKTELPEGSPVRADLDSILHAGAHAAQMTRQLLTFSRRQPIAPVPLDIGRQVQGSADMMRRLLGANVKLTIDVDESLPSIVIDPGHVEQIILNLAVNARDAMPDGGTLSISVRRVPSGVELAVRDSGTGMTEAVRARIFEPFFTTKEVGRGTGLGLATVLGIVKQAGGTITVDTVIGGGTAFRVTLPSERP